MTCPPPATDRLDTTQTAASFALPLLIAASLLMLAREPELRLTVPLMTGLTAFIMALLALILYRGERYSFCWNPALILGVALALRLMFLFAPPQLSDDIYRYLWDGSNLWRGVNPYAAPPAAMTPSAALKTVHAAINHPEYVTIYPPAAQVLFAAGSAFGGTVTGLKMFLVLVDLLLCGLLVLLLKKLQMPVWRAVLYAWNPLPVLEIAGSGHVDGGGMALFLAAFLLLLTCGAKRAGAACSGAIFAAAALVKLFPLVLGPVLFLLAPRPRRLHFLAGFCCGLSLLSLPFLPDLVRIRGSLEAYARNWEFAGFAFNALRGTTGSGTLARLTLVMLLLLFVAVLTSRAAGTPDEADPATRGRSALNACYAITMALLLTTPTLQPWYALMLAALLPFAGGPAGIVLCWAVLLTYRVQIPYFILGQWIESAPVTAVVFLAPAASWLASVGMRRFGRKSGVSAPCGN